MMVMVKEDMFNVFMDSLVIVLLKGIFKIFFNGMVVFDNLLLDIWQGEFVLLFGFLGCGKLIVLWIIISLIGLIVGWVDWLQEDVCQQEYEMSFVFQEFILMLWVIVFGNVWLLLWFKGIFKVWVCDDVMDVLEMVGLVQFVESYLCEFFGGMKMCVFIVWVLVIKFKFLFMDEFFVVFDEIIWFKLNNDLLYFWEMFGWMVVFVMYFVFEFVYLLNWIVVMVV